ncbi:hypothetical protein CDV31_013369 [Fusarium ambrosium]|uniref:Uncharacterized protein n=1 Tax=Fusarium ambrosium TaxID=131363 RepID=A0A428T3W5_9HYPO|nr:hypothetical protein CDV31_013369 [Fusarium ambrosium]
MTKPKRPPFRYLCLGLNSFFFSFLGLVLSFRPKDKLEKHFQTSKMRIAKVSRLALYIGNPKYPGGRPSDTIPDESMSQGKGEADGDPMGEAHKKLRKITATSESKKRAAKSQGNRRATKIVKTSSPVDTPNDTSQSRQVPAGEDDEELSGMPSKANIKAYKDDSNRLAARRKEALKGKKPMLSEEEGERVRERERKCIRETLMEAKHKASQSAGAQDKKFLEWLAKGMKDSATNESSQEKGGVAPKTAPNEAEGEI